MEQIKDIDERVVMFFTHYEVVRKRGSLIEATRKWWRCSEDKAMSADYVFSVISGIVQEVYIATGCHEEFDDARRNLISLEHAKCLNSNLLQIVSAQNTMASGFLQNTLEVKIP